MCLLEIEKKKEENFVYLINNDKNQVSLLKKFKKNIFEIKLFLNLFSINESKL